MNIPEPERKTFSGNRGEFSYLEWNVAGSDAPVLHFHHANGMNAYTYKRLLAPLSEKVRILALDIRGHGFTKAEANPNKLKTWHLYSDDLIEYLDFIGTPTVLAGHSLGGVVSLLVVNKRPDLVSGIVQIDPVMFRPGFLVFWTIIRGLGLQKRIPIATRAARRRSVWPSKEEMFEYYLGHGAFSTWQDEWIMDYLDGGTEKMKDGKIRLTCNPLWEAATFSTLPSRIWTQLSRVNCPITLIYGEKSDTFLEPASRIYKKKNGSASLFKLSNATHFVPMEEPEFVRQELFKMAEMCSNNQNKTLS